MATNSGVVSAGDVATALQYNNVRYDILIEAGDTLTDAGAADAYDVTCDAQITSLATGQIAKFIVANSNTATSTLRFQNGVALDLTDTIKKEDGSLLEVDDLTAGKVAVCVFDGTDWLLVNPYVDTSNYVIVEAGENATASQAGYLKAADSKVWKADASNLTEPLDNYIGIYDTTVTAGNDVKMLIGPVAKGLAGLTPGAVYYLTDTAGTIGTTPGTQFKPIGLAISATELLIFPTNGYKKGIGTTALNVPGIGATADTTIVLPFYGRSIKGKGNLVISDSGGANHRYITFDYFWDGTTCKGGLTITSDTLGGTTADAIKWSASAPVVTTGGAATSNMTLSVNAITAAGVVFRLTNAITAGAGSANNAAGNISYEIIG